MRGIPAATDAEALAWLDSWFAGSRDGLQSEGVRVRLEAVEADVDGPGGEERGVEWRRR